jgi:hypothetical protein
MALLFVDGCSHYATDDVLTKWAQCGMGITGNNPRRVGSRSLCGEYYNSATTPAFPSTNYAVAAMAVRHGSLWYLALYKGGVQQMRLYCDYANVLKVQRGSTPDALAQKDMTGMIFPNEWYHFSFASLIHDSAGTFDVRLNGIPIAELTLTGQDTKPGSDTGIDRVTFCAGSASGGITDIYVDNTTIHGDCIVETLYPTGVGAHSDWTPSAGANYQNVDDLGDIDGDTTYNASAVQGAKDSFVAGNLLSRPTSTIRGVALHLTARKDWSGSRVIKPMVRVSGTDYVHSADGMILSDVYHGMQRIWETNPVTSAAWSESAVNGAEIGYDLVTAS